MTYGRRNKIEQRHPLKHSQLVLHSEHLLRTSRVFNKDQAAISVLFWARLACVWKHSFGTILLLLWLVTIVILHEHL